MKDIRRQIERQTGRAAEVRGRQADGERVADGSVARHHCDRVRARRRAAGRRGLRHADEAEGAAAAAAHDGDDDVRGGRSVAVAGGAHAARRLAVGRRRRGGQPLLGPRHRRPDGAHGHPAGAVGPRARARRAGLRHRAGGAVVPAAGDDRERAVGVPRALGLPRLRVRLHDLAQAHDAAEHRDRRRRRRRAAAGRLGRGHRRRSTRRRCTCSRSSSTGRRRTSGRCRC